MNNLKIVSRDSNSNNSFESLVPLKVGMCITTRVDEDYNPPQNFPLPFHHFVYIVTDFNQETVFLVDTSHNNTTTINAQELEQCELVAEFHKNNLNIDCDHINQVLMGLYNR